MDNKLTLRQIDCASSKDGGLLLSLHLLPAGMSSQAGGNGAPKRMRRRRKKTLTSEQMLELARTAIDEAVSDQSELSRKAINRVGVGQSRSAAQTARAFRATRRPPWPG